MARAMEMSQKSLTSTRGFASMDREKQLAIARKGGASVPNEKRSFCKIPDWQPRLGERADRVSIPPSAAFRAITRSPQRPAARADMLRPRAEKSRRSSNEASFVKRKQSLCGLGRGLHGPEGDRAGLRPQPRRLWAGWQLRDTRLSWPHGGTAQLGETHRPTARRFEPLPNRGKGAWRMSDRWAIWRQPSWQCRWQEVRYG